MTLMNSTISANVSGNSPIRSLLLCTLAFSLLALTFAGAAQATDTQTADAASVALSWGSFTVNASDGTVVISIERKDAGTSKTTIGFKTSNGTAVAGADYSETSGNLDWAAGDRSVKKVLVRVDANAAGKLFHVSLAMVSGGASISAPGIAAVFIKGSAGSIPGAAVAAGYKTKTLGPEVTLNSNWYQMNFYRASNDATQNRDGTIAISGHGQGIASATRDKAMPHLWRGKAFGGGAYFEAIFHFADADASKLAQWPAFWGTDIENMSQNAVTEMTQWSGQPTGFGNWIETDFFEYDHQNLGEYGTQIHNWYGYHEHGEVQDVRGYTAGLKVANGFDWSIAHKYGYLWVPATAGKKGYVAVFMDDVQMGPTVYWDQYDASAPPSPKLGTTAFSVLDSRHLILTIETGARNPLTVDSVSVWQASDKDNLTD